jgi:hypothetical protein
MYPPSFILHHLIGSWVLGHRRLPYEHLQIKYVSFGRPSYTNATVESVTIKPSTLVRNKQSLCAGSRHTRITVMNAAMRGYQSIGLLYFSVEQLSEFRAPYLE